MIERAHDCGIIKTSPVIQKPEQKFFTGRRDSCQGVAGALDGPGRTGGAIFPFLCLRAIPAEDNFEKPGGFQKGVVQRESRSDAGFQRVNCIHIPCLRAGGVAASVTSRPAYSFQCSFLYPFRILFFRIRFR